MPKKKTGAREEAKKLYDLLHAYLDGEASEAEVNAATRALNRKLKKGSKAPEVVEDAGKDHKAKQPAKEKE